MNSEIDEIGIDDIDDNIVYARNDAERNLAVPAKKVQNGVARRFLRNLPALPHFEDKAQKRAGGNIIKFLAGLLALTLIARGTGAATLARVEVSNPARGEIVNAVTGSATVSVRDSLDITVPEGLTIIEMLAGTGQTLNTGDAIARFDMAEVQEKLEREAATLDKLLLDIEKLDRTDSTDSASLQNAMRNLRRAQDDYSTVEAQGNSDLSSANDALEEVLNELSEDPDAAAIETALRSLTRVRDDYDAQLAQGIADVAAAQAALNDALSSSYDSVDSTALENARRNRNREREDYASLEANVKAALIPAQSALDDAISHEKEMKEAWDADITNVVTEQAYLDAQAATGKAQEAYDEALIKAETDYGLQAAKRRLEDVEAAFNLALITFNNNDGKALNVWLDSVDKARDALDTAKKKADDNLLSAARRVEDAEVSLSTAEKNYDKSVAQVSDARKNELKNVQNALESAEKKASENLLSVARRVEDAEATLAAAERDYARNTQQSSDTAAQNNLSMISIKLDIEDKKEVVDTLLMLASNNGTLFTNIAGIVLTVKPEGSITGQDALVSFMDGAKGFEADLLLDKTQSDKLSFGDECQVTTGAGSMYYTPTVTGLISAISAPDDQDKVKVTIRLPDDDWTAGQRVDVRSVQSRTTYDLCVPLSAVHSDNTGYYLLTIEQQSTVLGIENTVIRLPVTITDIDDDNAAVQGPIGRNSKIVTGSNKAVDVGDRVRVSR